MIFKATTGLVELFLQRRPELSHLKVRARGSILTLESTDTFGNTCPHARLRKKSVHKYELEMPVRRGWEATFIEGSDEELMNLLVEKFPWALSPQ
jgi:hypothetical protein